MDSTDIKLLTRLAENADATATELMPHLNLSIPAINKRIAKMKESGVIRRVTVLTDPKKVGKPLIGFILIVLSSFAQKDTLLRYVEEDPDILECYAVTGEYDFILKICAGDIESFEDKLLKLKDTKGVAKSYTLLALMEHKFCPVPLPDLKQT